MSEPSRDATRIPRILYVDDEVQHAEAAADSLRVVDYTVDIAHSGEQALELLRGQPYDLLITDLVLGDMDGLGLMREALTVHPFLGIIMITGHGSIESAVEAMRREFFGNSGSTSLPASEADSNVGVYGKPDSIRKRSAPPRPSMPA